MKTVPNILFIVIDALRFKNLSCYGYPRPISPNIDKLAHEGLLFEDAYSCSNATDSSLTTIFSGMYPTSHGILGHGGQWIGKRSGEVETRKLDQSGIHLLPEMLKAMGYVTLAVDWLGRWHKRGYDYYSGMLREAKPASFPFRARARRFFQPIHGYRCLLSRRYAYSDKSTIIDDAHLITLLAERLIKENLDKDFFLFVHYWDVHSPYAPPTPFYDKISSEDTADRMRTRILALLSKIWTRRHNERIDSERIIRYLASIAYVDYEIGILVKTLEHYGILDDTLIIVTSDHGESLTEHEIYFDHHGLYDVSIRVPLIMKHSVFPKNKRVIGFVQHFDLVPTLLDLLGSDSAKFDGKSVLPLVYEKVDQLHSAVYAEEAYYQRKNCIRTSRYKYIRATSRKAATCRRCGHIHGGLEELYDVKHDPNETKNILEYAPRTSARLKKNLSEWQSICA